MFVMELFRKLLHPGLPKPVQLLLRRRHGLRTCMPSLMGTLTSGLPFPVSVRFSGQYSYNLEVQFSKLGLDVKFWLKIFRGFFLTVHDLSSSYSVV
jgi:hypothetical protein